MRLYRVSAHNVLAYGHLATPYESTEMQLFCLVLKTLYQISRQTCKAFYSSIVDGITTDPEGMQISISDHIVHRGRGVFDTATIGLKVWIPAHLDTYCHTCVL